MNRKYCYLIKICHPDGCQEDYVILDLSQIGSCINDYLSEYSCSLCASQLEIYVVNAIWKGDKKDG